MKTKNFTKPLLAAIAGLALLCGSVVAQNSPATTAPPLAYGVPPILQLAQAKVGDDVIISYIRNSGDSYGLDANQIIYLRQQGVSDNVINVMLNQPKIASTPAPTATQTEVSTAYAQPTTYVQTAPASSVYVIPDTQSYYYNSYYAQPYYYPYSYPYYVNPFPAVSFSFGFGGRFHDGFRGGGFRGGGWHR